MSRACSDCGELEGIAIDYREGIVVCKFCGRVQEMRIIDETLETRSFAKDSSAKGGDDPKRVGGANNNYLTDHGLSTVIGSAPSGENSLSRWANWSTHSSADRTLIRGFDTISHFISHLSLNDEVEEEAKKIFKVISEQKGLRGRTHDAIVAACIFKACRIKNNARTLKQIANMASIEKKELLKCHSVVSKYYKEGDPGMQDDVIVKFGKRIAIDVDFPPHLQKAAGEVGKRALQIGIVTGKNPMSIASAATYIVGIVNPGHQKPLSSISTASEMREVTIKNCVKIMLERKYELLRGICSEEAISSLNNLF